MYLCHYAIIRFMPFLETEEFANVGILLFAPQTGYAQFKLAPKRFGRVTKFFDDLDGAIYQRGLDIFETELYRVTTDCKHLDGKKIVDQFKEITRLREGVFRFGHISAVMCDNPTEKLEELFSYYVGRNFATKEYREQVMVRTLRGGLKKNVGGIHYVQKQLQGEFNTSINLPFVAAVGERFKVIKPLAFNQTKPIALLEHGEKWIGRIKRLLNNNTVQPNDMLFTVEKPKKQNEVLDAFYEVEREMRHLDVNIIPFADKPAIYNFARQPDNIDNFQLT